MKIDKNNISELIVVIKKDGEIEANDIKAQEDVDYLKQIMVFNMQRTSCRIEADQSAANQLATLRTNTLRDSIDHYNIIYAL